MVVRTDHSPLRHLPNQNAVNTRIWKWLAIVHGYNLDIQYTLGKVNPAVHLSGQSLYQAIRHKNVVRGENDKFVQCMRIPKDASDAQIQKILSDIVSRINSVQDQLQSPDQFNPVFVISPRQRKRKTSDY